MSFSGGPAMVEIGCHSPTRDGAAAMAEDIIAKLAADGRIDSILYAFDDADSPSGEHGRYFAHVLTVRLHA